MTLIDKVSELNGEFASWKESPTGAEPTQGAIAASGFDFNALRLSQAYGQTAGVEKLLTTVPVDKPKKTEFVRVHPKMHFDAVLLELKEDREKYLVSTQVQPHVAGVAVPVSLRLAVSRWISVRANMSLGAYDIYKGAESLSEPQWPDKSMEDIIKVAFRGRVIENAEHAVIKRLQGLA